MSRSLERLHGEISAALSKLSRSFVPGMRLTFVARLPGNTECELTVTDDHLPEVACVLARREKADVLAGRGGPKPAPPPRRLEDLNEPELRAVMSLMGDQLTSAAASAGVEKPLFVLVLFNDPALAQYVANCRREDCVKAMRETADRLEAKQDVSR